MALEDYSYVLSTVESSDGNFFSMKDFVLEIRHLLNEHKQVIVNSWE